MKKFIVLTLAVVFCATAAQGGLKGVGLDYVNTTYTATTQEFSMSDSGLFAILESDDGTQSIVSGLSLELITTLVSGMTFEGGQFLLSNDGGTLLAGTVISIDFTPGSTTLGGEGTAQVMESNLDGFPAGPADIISITFNLEPAFAGFDQDYMGESKINFQVPEPTILALLTLGGVMIRKRK